MVDDKTVVAQLRRLGRDSDELNRLTTDKRLTLHEKEAIEAIQMWAIHAASRIEARGMGGISRDDVIDAIGGLELRAGNLRDSAGLYAPGLTHEDKLRRAEHYEAVAARFRALSSAGESLK
jgi:hypothetical protein